MYSIYVHTTPDGRKYVGSTSLEPNKRFGLGSKYKHNTRFYDAIKSVGWNNIKHDILETVEDKETALKREEYYTLLWRTNEPEFGYNIYVGYIPNEEIRNKTSERCKGIKHSEDTNKKISEKLKGRKQSEETKNKISEIKKKPFILKNKNTGEIMNFYSQQSCAEFFGVCSASVHNFITGKSPKSKVFNDYEILK